MQNTTQQIFFELFKEADNNLCFECGSPSNHWASVNNGIFLCLNCSGLHRGFGVNISFVRSIDMDSWSDLQLAMMRNGGNARLRACFEHYNIPKDGPIDFKYRTRAAAYYREMLKALAEGRPLPNAPSQTEGLELVSNKASSYNSANITGFGSTPIQDDSAIEKVKSFMGTAVDKTVQVTKEAANKVSDPNFQEGVKHGVVTIGTTVAVGAKTFASKINEKVHDPAFREDVKVFGSKVATGTKEVAGKVAEKSKEIWVMCAKANRDEYISKSSEMAKQGFSSAIGFFKKLTKNNENSDTSNSGGASSGPNNLS